jgi:hypothetical protein
MSLVLIRIKQGVGDKPINHDFPCFKNRIVLFQLLNGYLVADRISESLGKR